MPLTGKLDDFKTREPLLLRAGITSGVTILAIGLALFGHPISDDQKDALIKLLGAAAGMLPLLLAVMGRKHVTSKYAPKDDNGTPLVPVTAVVGDVTETAGGLVGDVAETVGDAVQGVTQVIKDGLGGLKHGG